MKAAPKSGSKQVQPVRKTITPTPEYKALDPQRDLSTKNGSSQSIQLTVKEYLTQLGRWDGTTVSDLESDAAAEFQRGILDINTNKIKQQMFHDLLIGATLPPLIIHSDGEEWEIIDGLHALSAVYA